MALKYKLVQKRNLGKDQEENPEKVYAQMVSGDLVTFEELIEEVGDSTGSGDFSTGLIREPRVRFLPGKALRTMKSRTSFERVVMETNGGAPGGGEEERPGEL